MTDLGPILSRLGLDQYLDAFVGEGFDSWKTLLDITETDLDSLNVKLGHRRKLQRAIAETRGVSYDRALGSPAFDNADRNDGSHTFMPGAERGAGAPAETKRKYRRHPKPDEHAPERPPSAYVIFSNKIRDEIKGQNLSFTEIAKLVGERWQLLDPFEKEPYETQANAAKETYLAKLAKYKKTDSYRKYMQYLAEFKAKQVGPSSDIKRPKFGKEDSDGSANSYIMEAQTEAQDNLNDVSKQGHARMRSLPSTQSTSQHVALPSPTADSSVSSPRPQSIHWGNGPAGSPGTDSPPALAYRDVRPHHRPPSLIPQNSNASDVSVRSYMTQSQSGFTPGGYTSESGASNRPWPLLQHQDTSASSQSSLSYGSGSSGPFGPYSSGEEPPWPRRMSSTEGASQIAGDLALIVHPPLASRTVSNHATHSSLPPLKPPEAMGRWLPDPSSRVLPLPMPSSLDSANAFRPTLQVGTLAQKCHGPQGDLQEGEVKKSPLESSENEAASSLAALASGAHTPRSRRDRLR